jgi:tetratricopeptide (TPR) repeat protein
MNLADLWMLQAVRQGATDSSIRAQALYEQLAATQLAAQAHRNAMKLAFLEGRMADATWLGEQALGLEPEVQLTGHFLGNAYWALGVREEARHAWRTTGVLPYYLHRFSIRGWESFAAGNPEQAIAIFEQGLDYDPSWPDGYWALSTYYWQTNQIEKAVQLLERLEPLLDADTPRLTFVQGRLALAAGDVERATNLFCSALAGAARPEHLHGCLWGLKQRGDTAQALEILRSARPHLPDQVTAAAANWAEWLVAAGDAEGAAPFTRLACEASRQAQGACSYISNPTGTVQAHR